MNDCKTKTYEWLQLGRQESELTLFSQEHKKLQQNKKIDLNKVKRKQINKNKHRPTTFIVEVMFLTKYVPM